jgi:hypothetical protein
MRKRNIGKAQVAGLCIGGNPFSGFSHQGAARNQEMLDYYTDDRVKATLAQAEKAGIDTFFGRTDLHIFELLRQYWQAGGQIQWFAQVCVERGRPDAWKEWLEGAIELGCTAAYIHGGVADFWHANGQWDNFHEALGRMRDGGVVAGFAAHRPQVHEWMRDHLELDFHMCSYYNPTDRSKSAHHQEDGETWDDKDRDAMLEVIATLAAPAVHYKVFGGGNKPVLQAFEVMGQHMRENDIALVGFFTKDDEAMIQKDVALFDEHVDAVLA